MNSPNYNGEITPKGITTPLKLQSPGDDRSSYYKKNSFSPERHISLSLERNRRKSYLPLGMRKAGRRALFKSGNPNVVHCKNNHLRYLQDIFNTLVDCQWRWTTLAFSVAFFGSWWFFTFIWLLISLTHGDLEEDHLPVNQIKSNWTPCVTHIEGFTSAFLFSVETQHTTGYGIKVITDECPEAIFTMCVQSIVGLIIQSFMVGIVFAKMTRPKLRTQTLQFSKKAVICQRDGFLCLMFRLGDMRKSFIIGTNVTAQLIHTKLTREGETLENYQTELSVRADSCNGNFFFIWPLTIIHKIDEDSPLFYLSATDLIQEKFEIVVILEGTIETTGQATQARSSYLSSEILWGHKFEKVVTFNKELQNYEIDDDKFNNTHTIDTPLCSAAELNGFYMEHIAGETSLKLATFLEGVTAQGN